MQYIYQQTKDFSLYDTTLNAALQDQPARLIQHCRQHADFLGLLLSANDIQLTFKGYQNAIFKWNTLNSSKTCQLISFVILAFVN